MAAFLRALVRGRGLLLPGVDGEEKEDSRLGVGVASPLLQERDEGDAAAEEDAAADALEKGENRHKEPLLGPVSPTKDDKEDDEGPEEDGGGKDPVDTDGVNSFGRESWEQLRLAVPTSVTRTLAFVARISSIVFVGQLLPVEKLASAALANSMMVGARPDPSRVVSGACPRRGGPRMPKSTD